LALYRDELKRLLKEKGVKSLDDFNAFMREVSKEGRRVLSGLLELDVWMRPDLVYCHTLHVLTFSC
jgi:hypothetical protein